MPIAARRRFLARIGVAHTLTVAMLASPMTTQAQDYPKSPVTIVVGFAAGSTADVSARIVGNRMGETLGQRFIVENRVGASSSTAASAVARAPKDGYTLFVGSVANIVNAAMRSDLGFDFSADFAPITLMTSTPMILVATPALGAKTVKDIIRISTERPEPLLFGSSGVGSSTHLAMELFKSLTAAKITHVPYTGSPGVVTDLLGDRLNGFFAPAQAVMEHVTAGKLVALAVTDPQRSAYFPELPTIAEGGVANFQSMLWFGLMAPAGTPQPVIETLARAANEALQSTAVRQLFEKQFVATIGGSPDAFKQTIAAETARWTPIVAVAGLKK